MALRACRALAPLVAEVCGEIIITCDPDNRASRRTIELLGAEFLGEQAAPPADPAYAAGRRRKLRYRWAPGTIAMWDNRCTQHHVLNDFEGERVIQRVTIMDDTPEAASPPRWPPYERHRAVSAASYREMPLRRLLDEKNSTT